MRMLNSVINIGCETALLFALQQKIFIYILYTRRRRLMYNAGRNK